MVKNQGGRACEDTIEKGAQSPFHHLAPLLFRTLEAVVSPIMHRQSEAWLVQELAALS